MRSRILMGFVAVVFISIFTIFINPAAAIVLYDNGPLVNSPGTGAGGADESTLQTGLGMTTYGFGHQVALGYRVADDFQVTDADGWDLTTITFFAYQTGSTTTSTITQVNLRIWDGIPGAVGSNVIFGDTTTNIMSNTQWSNIYRVLDTASGNTDRPIMANTVDVNTHLDQGTYWLDWSTDGTLGSGPFAPPITITGQATTGNGLQSTDGAGVTYGDAQDGGTVTPQGFPFIIEGDLVSAAIPTLSEWGVIAFIALILGGSMIMMKRRRA